MASQDPGSSLPVYYGEKTTDGTVVKRNDVEHNENPLHRHPVEPSREHPTSSVPLPSEGPGLGPTSESKQQRWSADDPRRGRADDYWQAGPGSYWERRRLEREMDRDRDWFPEYRGPESRGMDRFIEYDRPPGGVRTSGMRRERDSRATQYRNRRRSWDDDERIPRRVSTRRRRDPESDEEYIEEYYDSGKGARKGRGVGGGGRGPPPREDNESDHSGPKRLPYTRWMGMSAKGRK